MIGETGIYASNTSLSNSYKAKIEKLLAQGEFAQIEKDYEKAVTIYETALAMDS